MIEIRNLTTYTLEEGLAIWNQGFEGYFSDMNFTMERWISRFALEGLSPEASIVISVDGEAAGFVLSGIRMVNGKKVAWNGGTGVATKFRGQGLGTRLIEGALDVYRQQGVQIAVLEAMVQNERAIRLYEKMGYQTIDRVTFVSHRGTLSADSFDAANLGGYTIHHGLPVEVAGLPFYQAMAPWQAQWQGIRDGESIILYDKERPIGYALFKRTFNDSGQVSAVALYQCEAEAEHRDQEEIIHTLLGLVYAPRELECMRYTVNLPISNPTRMDALTKAGFTTLTEQVYMEREMEG